VTGTVKRRAQVAGSTAPRDLTALFAPRGIAVIGASRDRSKLGSAMTRGLAQFPGAVVGVNQRDVDLPERRYASVRDAADHLGCAIDLAVLCIPAAVSASALTEAASSGVRAALVCAGGFAEVDQSGAGHQCELVAAAQAAGVALLGPNTSGFVVPRRRLSASFVPGAAALRSGPVAVVAASGGVNHALAFQLAGAGSGVSLAVGIGNGADVTAVDVLRHLVDDDETTCVALHVEAVPDGPALVAAVAELAASKPVAVLVVGRNDVAEFARSHTGALATSWRTTRAALASAGAVLVDDERELVDAAVALSFGRLAPRANSGVGVVTAQAGPGLLHTDGLRGAGVDVPPLSEPTVARLAELLPPLTFQRNPVDTGRPGESFGEVVRAVAADPSIALTSVYALTEPGVVDLPAALGAAGDLRAVVGLGGPEADVREQRDRLRERGIPAVVGPTALTNSVRALVADARLQIEVEPRSEVTFAAVAFDRPPDENEAKSFLDSLGVPTTSRRACATRDEARHALGELTGPVAVKLLDAAVTHKTDVGGVHLDVGTVEGLERALDALEAVGASRFLVETMAPSGVDLIVGATRDPVFGPQVLVGLGGTVAEALDDVAVSPAPLGAAAAARMLDRLAGRALLDGFRSGPAVDRMRVGGIVAALGDVLAASPGLDSIEINPLRVTGRDVLALDAVITLANTPPRLHSEGEGL